jgi:hypothetical protein
MKLTWKLAALLFASVVPCAYAQEGTNVTFQSQAAGPVTTVTAGAFLRSSGTPVQGAPYSATITNESIQTLADGNRIVQNSTGTTARDSQGRTRQDVTLPSIGNLSAAEAPHFVFIQDPVAQTSYTLNLTDKSAQKSPMPPASGGPSADGPSTFAVQTGTAGAMSGTVTSSSTAGGALPPPPPLAIAVQKILPPLDDSQLSTEDLGSQSMEGVVVNGVRSTRTIPAGQMGNEKPIVIITEVWTSPDLKTVVLSKRSDPRMGEQTFKLTNLLRSDPDPSLFVVPSDFKIVDGPQQHVLYRTNR